MRAAAAAQQLLLLASSVTGAHAQIRLHQLQMLHAHNAYHACPLPGMIAGFSSPLIGGFITAAGLSAEALQYGHPSLLDLVEKYGVRSIEIDVFWDPIGGRYGYRAGPKIIKQLGLWPNNTGQQGPSDLFTPGFKVMHIPDLDFQASCNTLPECLAPLRQWSDRNRQHTPLIVSIEYKSYNPTARLTPTILALLKSLLTADPALPTSLAVTPEVDEAQVTALEQEVLAAWDKSRIYTPDDFRGRYAHLQERITRIGWPAVASLRGKTLFRVFGASNFTQLYQKLRPAGKKAVLFIEDNAVSSLPYRPSNDTIFTSVDLGLARLWNPKAVREANITNLQTATPAQLRVLAENYRLGLESLIAPGRLFIRATADQDTVQARMDFLGFTNAVMAGGAQLIHTDYPNGWKGACGPTNTTYSARVQQLMRGTWDNVTMASFNATLPKTGVLVSACNVVTAPSTCVTWNRTVGFKRPSSCSCYVKI